MKIKIKGAYAPVSVGSLPSKEEESSESDDRNDTDSDSTDEDEVDSSIIVVNIGSVIGDDTGFDGGESVVDLEEV